MYSGSAILLCVTIFVIHKQCLIRAHCSIVTVGAAAAASNSARKGERKISLGKNGFSAKELGCHHVLVLLYITPNFE
jgi:hypothetical protein